MTSHTNPASANCRRVGLIQKTLAGHSTQTRITKFVDQREKSRNKCAVASAPLVFLPFALRVLPLELISFQK
jgi:hypothetical protein